MEKLKIRLIRNEFPLIASVEEEYPVALLQKMGRNKTEMR
jgi:hypothetical protein